MKTEHIVLGGLALGGLALALSPEARKKTKKAVGLSDRGKEPAKIKKLREIANGGGFQKISGSIVDEGSAGLILQIYDNLPPHIRSGYAKKSVQEMSAIAYKIKGAMK